MGALTNRWIEAKMKLFENGSVNIAVFLVEGVRSDTMLPSIYENVPDRVTADTLLADFATAQGISPENVTIVSDGLTARFGHQPQG